MSCLPGGSSQSAQATRLATLARSAGYVVRQKFHVFAARDQTKHLSLVVDSGAEMHLLCLAHKHFMNKRDEFDFSLATGDRWRRLDPRHDWGPALWRYRVLNPLAQPGVRKIDISMRDDVLRVTEC